MDASQLPSSEPSPLAQNPSPLAKTAKRALGVLNAGEQLKTPEILNKASEAINNSQTGFEECQTLKRNLKTELEEAHKSLHVLKIASSLSAGAALPGVPKDASYEKALAVHEIMMAKHQDNKDTKAMEKEYATAMKAQLDQIQSLKDMKTKVKEKMNETYKTPENNRAVVTAKKIVESQIGKFSSLKEGEAVKLSREVGYHTHGLERSVTVIKRGEGFEYVVKIHQHTLDHIINPELGKKIEDKSVKKELGHGGMYRLFKQDAGGGKTTLLRKAKDKELPEQKKIQNATEDTFAGNRFFLLPVARPKDIKTPAKNLMKKEAGSIYTKYEGSADNVFKTSDAKGGNLGAPVPKDRGMAFIYSNAIGMRMMHEKHVYHGDNALKNKLVDSNGLAIQNDFDSARNMDKPVGKEAKQQDMTTTPLYASPEYLAYASGPEAGSPSVSKFVGSLLKSEERAEKSGSPEELARVKKQNLELLYEKTDVYTEALNVFLVMTGELPQHLKDLPKMSNANLVFHIAQNTLDNPDYKKAVQEKLQEAVVKGNYPQEVADWVLAALNPSPAERPTMADLEEISRQHTPGNILEIVDQMIDESAKGASKSK